MSIGDFGELFGFAEDPEFLQTCERGRTAFSEAVAEQAAHSAETVRRQRTDQPERSVVGRQQTRRIRGDMPFSAPGFVDVGAKKSARVTGTRRAKLVSDLRKQYEKGASIRALAERTGRSYGFVHRVLTEAGVELRGRGGATRSKKAR